MKTNPSTQEQYQLKIKKNKELELFYESRSAALHP